ncbi:hypothetical protein Trco_005137 [Trichoderma cornu-damae]|uniref:RNA polymerase I, subunit RPA34.5 n=1 Tax=Trichoderma cornu-damae TaxID=654480 RepID=A0A9P8QIW1_9HYPO|nr:hypothetical protein Trco_005137 [Trichoderma cornu-damae]
MAPKEPFQVHSLSKHIEDTKKGLSASAQYNRRPVSKSASAVKNEAGVVDSSIFGNNDDSDESSESSDSDSDGESSADFMKKLSANGAKPSTAPKRRSRDEEIADSDVERNASAKRTAAAKTERHVKKEPSSSSESTSDSSSESESGQSEPEAKTNGASGKQAAAAQESSSSSSEEESEQEEDDEDDEDDDDEAEKQAGNRGGKEAPKAEAKKSTVPAAANGTSAPNDSSSSSEEESSEEESSEDEAESSKPEAAKKAAEDSSSDSEDSESEEEDDDDDDVDEQVDESMHLSDREMSSRGVVPSFIAPDFTLRKGDDGANGQDVARVCNEANLQGKQFWYFTVPSNVPISVIQNLEIPVDRSQLGGRVFSHEGQDYGVSFDTIAPKSSIQILIPSASDSKYRPARQQIDQTMHIKRITSLGGASASSSGPAPRRAPRPQPRGLRARYQPFGVNTPMGDIGADAPEDGDVEMGEAPEAAATPKSAKKDKKGKKEDAKQSKNKDKKKSADDDAAAAAAAAAATLVAGAKPSKADRKGKRKHTVSEDDTLAAAEQLREENDSAESKFKKQKVARVSSPDLGAEVPSTTRKETPIAPPTVPSSSHSFHNLPSSASAIATPSRAKTAATPSMAKKATKKAKPETPIPTPRQTAVPLPSMPMTSRPKESPVPLPSSSSTVFASSTTPLPSKTKKTKKAKDEVNVIGSSQQSPPPSAQGGDKKRPAIKANRLG